jgi:SdrD B-like domain
MSTLNKKTKLHSPKGLRLLACGLFAFLLTAFTAINAQTVTIEKAIASGCYYYSGASKTTISVQVGWTGASNGDQIVVTLDGTTTRKINPESYYDPGSGSAVAGPIEINSDGASHSLRAVLSGAHSATSATVNITAPSACAPMSCSGTDLGGMVYFDNNANGTHDAGEIKGVAGVTVKAFDKNGNSYTATSDAAGRYAFSAANGNAIAAANFPVRVEFTNFPSSSQGYAGPSLTGNTSSVRFIASPACGVDCGAVNPTYYSQSNPAVFTNLYTTGDPLAGGNAGTQEGLIEHSYLNNTDFAQTVIATTDKTGSLWAHAWNKYSKTLFSAASLKRHFGLGPLGLGGIYKTNYSNPASPVFSNFIDVTTIGINVGQASVPSNSARGLVAEKTTPSADADVYDLIGKVGIGGMDISEDGNKIYFMNLYDNKVYAIDITAYNTSGTAPTAANVTSFAVPNPGCIGGQFHAYAVKVYEGKVYAGMVCDGSSSSVSNMVATIKAMDLTTHTWIDVFDFPLSYPRGYGFGSTPQNTGWYPWQSTPTNQWNAGATTYPEPILSG